MAAPVYFTQLANASSARLFLSVGRSHALVAEQRRSSEDLHHLSSNSSPYPASPRTLFCAVTSIARRSSSTTPHLSPHSVAGSSRSASTLSLLAAAVAKWVASTPAHMATLLDYRRMSQHPSDHVSKGKKVVDECDQPKRCRHNFVPPIPTSVVIREPSNPGSLSHGSSDDEDVPSQIAMAFPTCSIITPIATLERGESSKGRKRSYDSARYARLTPEQRKTRQDRQKARRQSLTPEKRQEINARRRAHRQSLPPEKRQALLNQHKASYKARRDTICDESIAMRCPALGASAAITPFSGTSVSTTSNGD